MSNSHDHDHNRPPLTSKAQMNRISKEENEQEASKRSLSLHQQSRNHPNERPTTGSSRRSVTFSPEQRMTYFTVQPPWVQEEFQQQEHQQQNDHSPSDDDDSHQVNVQPKQEETKQHPSEFGDQALFDKTIAESDNEESKAEESRDDLPERDDNLEEDSHIDQTKANMSMASDARRTGSTQSSASNIYQPPTQLHAVCFSARSANDLLDFYESLPTSPGLRKLIEVTSASSQLDSRGRTPLHLLSENKMLPESLFPINGDYDDDDDDSIPGLQPSTSFASKDAMDSKRHATAFLLDVLLAANPMAIKLPDAYGHVPFQLSLKRWIHIQHNVDSPKQQRWGLGSRRFSSYSRLTAPSKIQHMWHNTSNQVSNAITWAGRSIPFANGSPRSMEDDTTPIKGDDSPSIDGSVDDLDDDVFDNGTDDEWALDHFPSTVQLTPQVKFAIHMLSTILEHLDDYVLSRSFKRRSLLKKSNESEFKGESFDAAMDDFRDYAFTESSDKIAADVVQEIAAIPYLVKTFLLLHDHDERQWVFSSTLFQRVAMHKNSIGPWLTGVLQSSRKGVAQRGLDYLVYLSRTLEQHPDGWGIQKRKSSANLMRPVDAHADLHEKVSEMEGFIPSLLALDQNGIEEAATTLVVRKVLDRLISRPFAISVIFFDSIFLALLIVSFRAAVGIFLLGGSSGTVLSWIYVSNACTFYFIIRELGKGITILERTRVARIYFLSFWNLTDISSICLALASTICIRIQFKQDEIDYANLMELRGLLAVTTGFLWLRVLSLLKSINMQLATFVLAIFQITRDIMWFLLILFALVVSFAQMFYTILVPPECAYDEPPTNGLECRSAEYYLQTYSILLGDFGNFDRAVFTTAFSVILIVLFSFMVVIVLLNVLIAIVSDSYEKCLIRSKMLFGRARVMLIAELASFQNLLRKDTRKEGDAPESIYSQWWYGTFGSGNQRWSRGSVVFFLLSALVVLVWFIAETVGYFRGRRIGNYIFSLCSILVNVILYCFIVAMLSSGASSANNGTGSRRVLQGGGCVGFIWKWYHDVVQMSMLRLLGSNQDNSNFFGKRHNNNKEVDDWSGRVNYLQREMARFAEESTLQMTNHARAMEQSVTNSESRLRSEVKTVDESMSDFRQELMNEMKESEQRMQEVILQSMNQLVRVMTDGDD